MKRQTIKTYGLATIQSICLVMLALIAIVSELSADTVRTNTWISVTGGNWSDTANWLDPGFYPNGTNDVAIFDSRPPLNDDITKATETTIVLDEPVVLGELHLRNRYFTLSSTGGNKLTMAVDSGSALIRSYERIAGITRQNLINVSVHAASDLEIRAEDMGLKFGGTTSSLTSESDLITITLNMNTPLQGDAILELGNCSQFSGTLRMKRDNIGGSGFNFATTDARFPGGSVIVESSANARISSALTDARLNQMTILPGASILFRSSASVVDCDDGLMLQLLNATRLALGDANSKPVDRWGDAAPLPLLGTSLIVDGPSNSDTIETVGDITYENGAMLSLKGRGATYEISLSAQSLSRKERGTLAIVSDSAPYHVGTANSRFLLASPDLQEGRLPASVVLVRREGTTTAEYILPYLCGYDSTLGIIPLQYDVTNSFGNAGQTVWLPEPLDLNGAVVDAFAVAVGGTGADGKHLHNGVVRISSGLLAIRGRFHRFDADFLMGDNGLAEGLIYTAKTSGGDVRRNDGLTGSLHCNGLTKFGSGMLRLSGNNTNLFGSIRINQGSLAIDAQQAVSNTNDIWMCSSERLLIAATSVIMGGLSSDPGAIVRMDNTQGPSILSLNPPVDSIHRFQGIVDNAAGNDNVMTLEIGGLGVQGLCGNIGSPIVVRSHAKLCVTDGLTGNSLECDADSTIIMSAEKPLILSGNASLPSIIHIADEVIEEGKHVLIATTGGITGELSELDLSEVNIPNGMLARLRIEDDNLLLNVGFPLGTTLILR